MILERKRRHLERYIEIGRILATYGWENLLGRLGLADLFRLRKQVGGVPPGPVQVREAIEELGPTFIKLGQALSTRGDILPAEYVAELEKLQDAAPPVPHDDVCRVISEELGAPADDVFARFDETPLASASLGQAHAAALADGREVVVKVQRPGVRQTIETDLEILAGVAHFLEQHFEQARTYGLSDLVDEFSIAIHQELDYTREGRNGDRLRENFADIPYVRIAETIWDHATSRVLTLERMSGVKINDLREIDIRGYNRRKIATNLTRAFLKMIFVDGLFHSDPHPGNLVVLDDNVVGLLDYGQVGRLDSETKTHVTMLLAAYVQEDSASFAEVLVDMGTAPPGLNRHAFTSEIDRLLRQYYGVPVSEVQIGEVLRRALQVSAKHRVKLPAGLALLVKATMEVEAADNLLDPDYNLASEAKPFIEQSIRGEFAVGKMRTQLLQNVLQWKSLFLDFPHKVAEVLDNMAKNSFRIIFKHEGLEGPIRDIDRSANRLSFALIASATIVASALILSAKVGPMWRGYPVVGLIGFALAFVFAVYLMISIIRAGKLW